MNYSVYPIAMDPYFCRSQQIGYTCLVPLVQYTNHQLALATGHTIIWLGGIPIYQRPRQEPVALAMRMMSVEQTANWIKHLALGFGWHEAEHYARQFQSRNISGEFLQHLTDERLIWLLITNYHHRALILWHIRQIFSPPTMIPLDGNVGSPVQEMSRNMTASSDMGLHTGRANFEKISCESPDPPAQRDEDSTDTLYRHCGTSSKGSSKSLSSMEISESEISYETNKKCVATSLWARSLFLKRISFDDQLTENEQIVLFHSRFKKYGFKIENISPAFERSGEFVVKFESIMKAQEALLKAKDIGYDLKPRRVKRPSPKCPCRFKVLSKLTVREGRALDTEFVTEKFRNDVVFVNKVRGRRARLVDNRKRNETVGWASLCTKFGKPLLEQLEQD